MKKIWLVLGTLFFIGYIPGPTGTYGSLVTTVIVYLLKPYWSASLYIQAIAIAGIFIIGTAAGSYLEQHLDRKDPRHCVIDELAGQMVSLLLVPHTLVSYFFAFLLFRLFDILKPFPFAVWSVSRMGWGL